MRSCCLETFAPRTTRQRFCSDECRREEEAASKLGVDGVDRPAMTLAAIGEIMGIGQSGADHIAKKALRKLRSRLRREDWL